MEMESSEENIPSSQTVNIKKNESLSVANRRKSLLKKMYNNRVKYFIFENFIH
jgi:hypothetical protein